MQLHAVNLVVHLNMGWQATGTVHATMLSAIQHAVLTSLCLCLFVSFFPALSFLVLVLDMTTCTGSLVPACCAVLCLHAVYVSLAGTYQGEGSSPGWLQQSECKLGPAHHRHQTDMGWRVPCQPAHKQLHVCLHCNRSRKPQWA